MPGLLHDVLARRAAAHPGAPAFTVDGVSTLDYLSWHEGARRAAAGLAARGVRPGARVVLAFEDDDWLSFVTCFMGVLAAGGVAVPVRAPVPAVHLLTIATRVDAAGLVLGGRQGGEIAFGGWLAHAGDLTAFAGADAVPEVRIAESDPAAVILTSGTTGAAKAVLSTHASLTDDWDDGDDVPPPQDNALFTSVAVGTNAAQSVLRSCLLNGVHVVLGQPERLAHLIEEHRVTALSLVPTTARLAVAALRREGRAPARVRSVVSSSAPLDQPTVDGLAEVFPEAEIFNVYTVAEGGGGLQHRCLVGRPPALGALGPGARLVDDAGRDVAPGQTGELWLRHTGPALSYLTPAEPAGQAATGTRYLADGWIATGDLCRLGDDGLVYFVERADDVIVSGGLNIASATVEGVLRTHPAVADVAVFGVPHAALGRAVAAAVVLTAPATPSDLREHCAGRLPYGHVPVDVVVVPELPLTPNGKVRKRQLADDHVLRGEPEPARTAEDEVDRAVLAAFRDAFAGEPVRRDSDFFRLGGHSLLAVRLAADLERRTGRSVEPALVLRHPRIGDLSAALRGRASEAGVEERDLLGTRAGTPRSGAQRGA